MSQRALPTVSRVPRAEAVFFNKFDDVVEYETSDSDNETSDSDSDNETSDSDNETSDNDLQGRYAPKKKDFADDELFRNALIVFKEQMDICKSQRSLNWLCTNDDLKALETEFSKFGPVEKIVRRYSQIDGAEAEAGTVVYVNAQDSVRALNAEVYVSNERIYLVRADLDPEDSEFENKTDAWKSNLVKVMEASYVFTDVTWPMYQLIPIELRPKFWVGFNRMAYVDRYQVIYHHVMIDVLENELKWPDVLAVTFACPEALSLARRTEDAINNVVTVSIPSMKELRVGHKVTVGQINPTKLAYNGKPFDFRADIELSEAIKEVVEKMQDTPYRDKTSHTAVRGLVKIIESIYKPSSKLDQELDDLIYSMSRKV